MLIRSHQSGLTPVLASRRRPLYWPGRAGLLTLGLALATCQGSGTPPAQAEPAASASVAPPTTAASFSLTIDGEPQSVQTCTLTKPKTQSGFVMGFEAGQASVAIIGSLSTRLAVGKYAVRDTTRSDVQIDGQIPPKLVKKSVQTEPSTGFITQLGLPAGHPLAQFLIYDWGQGLQALHGRELGQLVFTRVADGTADGSFQSFVYMLVENRQIKHQGQDKGLIKFEEHQVRGTFKNIPVGDAEKAMGDLQKAIKDLQKATGSQR